MPIIAPPENYVGGLAVSAESLAIMRVRMFVERELDQRAADGFSARLFYPGTNTKDSMIDADSPIDLDANKCSIWESALGIGRARRLGVINWLLNVCCL